MANLWINGEVNDALLHDVQLAFESIDPHEDLYCYINSEGGEVQAGWKIYELLQSHEGHVTTINTGMAGSIASIIFLGGKEKLMQEYSFMFIHHPWCMMQGNADQMRDTADKLEEISEYSVDVYESNSSLDKQTIRDMMTAETFISCEDCIKFGFADGMYESEQNLVTQSVKKSLYQKIFGTPKTPNQIALNNLRKLK